MPERRIPSIAGRPAQQRKGISLGKERPDSVKESKAC
jgi:hypothetical protein